MKWNASGAVDTEVKQRKTLVESSATNEPVDHEIPPGEAVRVVFRAGLTLNLGDYHMARVDVGLELPCAPTDVDATYDKVRSWVTDRLRDEVANVRKKYPERF